jgi:hypothetical protein
MLEKIFGNSTAEKALLHIYHYGSIHAAAVAGDYGIAVTPIHRQLERFEEAGILVAKSVGRTRLYAWNPKSPLTRPVQELVGIAYNAIPLKEREALFGTRRRPRRKGKPVL